MSEQDQHAALVARLQHVGEDACDKFNPQGWNNCQTCGCHQDTHDARAAAKLLAASPAGASEQCSLEDDCQCEACVRERGLVNRDGTVLKLTRYGRAAYDAGKAAGASERRVTREQDWQAIETAPQMRKLVVFYRNALGKGRTVLACYYRANALEMHDDYAEVGTYDEASGTSYAPEGWYEEHEGDSPLMSLEEQPTHWMPLPTPPEVKP